MDRVALAKLDALCDRAIVCRMSDLHDGVYPDNSTHVIGMRHDCDDRAYESILPMAQWEARRGRASTYYLLHTAPWYDKAIRAALPARVAELGHEIGLHYNWTPSYEKGGVDPCLTLDVELKKLRQYADVRSIAGHGDDACYRLKLVNYSMFAESGAVRYPWQDYTEATGFAQVTLDDFALDFHAEFVPKALYISDSGDTWQPSLSEAADLFPAEGKTVILQHPDWYAPRLFA